MSLDSFGSSNYPFHSKVPRLGKRSVKTGSGGKNWEDEGRKQVEGGKDGTGGVRGTGQGEKGKCRTADRQHLQNKRECRKNEASHCRVAVISP